MGVLNKTTEFKERLIKFEIKSFTKLGKSIHKLVLISDQLFEWDIGQYIAIIHEGHSFYFSIASHPNQRYVELHIKESSSSKLNTLLNSIEKKLLKNILIEGPLGECIFLKDEKKCSFICAGTGYAQIRPMLLELLNKPYYGRNDTLIILVNSELDIYDSDFINHLNEIGLINTYIVLSNGSCERFQYLKSLPSALKKTILPMDNVYISGNKGLSVDVSKIIRSNGHIGKINSDSL